jgi:hypothetical protein
MANKLTDIDSWWHRRYPGTRHNSVPKETASSPYKCRNSILHFFWSRVRRPERKAPQAIASPQSFIFWTTSLRLRARDSIYIIWLSDGARSIEVVWTAHKMVSDNSEERDDTCTAESRYGPTVLCTDRSERFLHFHNSGGGRRKEAYCEEISGYLHSHTEGKLHSLAGSADSEFQSDATAVPSSVCEHGRSCLDRVPKLDEFQQG